MNKEPAIDLETVDTQALADELRRRSKVFFMCARPMAEGDYNWSRCWGVDGLELGKDMPPEALARVLGLIEMAKFDMLYVKPALDDIV